MLRNIMLLGEAWTTRWTSDMTNMINVMKIDNMQVRIRRIALYACGLSVAYLVSRKVVDVARRKIYNYPPGEIGLPLLGCLIPFLTIFQPYGACKPNNYLQRLSNRNGPISLIKLGMKDTVIIHDYDMMRQVASKPPYMIHAFRFSEHFLDVNTHNGSEYLYRRSVLLQSFILAMNPKNVINHGHCLDSFPKSVYPDLDRIANDGGAGDNVIKALKRNIDYALFSSVFIVLFGQKGVMLPQETSEEYKTFVKVLHNSMEQIKATLFVTMTLPSWIVKPMGFMFGNASHYHTNLVNMVNKWVQEHNASHRGKDAFCAVDKMIQLMKNYPVYDVSILVGGVFEASIHTTQETIVRCIALLARHEDIQNRVYEEIRQKIAQDSINRNTDIGIEDDDDYPMGLFKHGTFACLKACVNETVRMLTTVGAPRTLVHQNLVVGGYNLPKGASLFLDFAAVDCNEKFWKGDTSKFEIDRWLTTLSDGSVVFEDNKFYAGFGMGKRGCPGKAVGLSNSYLFLGMILVRYSFTMDANQEIKIVKRKKKHNPENDLV